MAKVKAFTILSDMSINEILSETGSIKDLKIGWKEIEIDDELLKKSA